MNDQVINKEKILPMVTKKAILPECLDTLVIDCISIAI